MCECRLQIGRKWSLAHISNGTWKQLNLLAVCKPSGQLWLLDIWRLLNKAQNESKRQKSKMSPTRLRWPNRANQLSEIIRPDLWRAIICGLRNHNPHKQQQQQQHHNHQALISLSSCLMALNPNGTTIRAASCSIGFCVRLAGWLAGVRILWAVGLFVLASKVAKVL